MIYAFNYIRYVISSHPGRVLCISFLMFQILVNYMSMSSALLCLLVIGFSLLLSSYKKKLYLRMIFVVCSVGVSFAVYEIRQTQIETRANIYEKITIDQVEGVIISDPKVGVKDVKYTIQIPVSDEMLRSSVEQNAVEQIKSAKTPSITLLVQSRKFPRYSLGDRCWFSFANSTNKSLNEGYLSYLQNKGIDGTYRSFDLKCQPPDKTTSIPLFIAFRRFAYNIKLNSSKKIESMISEPYAALWLGILFGDDRDFSNEMTNLFKITQTTHIIAASGFNISVVEMIINRFSKRYLRMRTRMRFILLISFIYCLWADLSGSILRAFCMSALRQISKLLGYRYNSLDALLYTTVLLSFTMINPIVNMGYLLSSAATLGIMLIFPVISNLTGKIDKTLLKSDFVQNMTMSFSCSISTYPFILLFWGKASLLGVISNIFLLEIVELIYFNGLLTLIISYLSPVLAKKFLHLQFYTLDLFVWLINRFGLLFESRSFSIYVERSLLILGIVSMIYLSFAYIRELSRKFISMKAFI